MRAPKLLTYKDVVGISTLQQVSQGGTVNIFTGPVQVGAPQPQEQELERLQDGNRTYKKITISVPQGWRIAQSTVYGYPYYIHEKDNKTQWEPPEFDETLAVGRKGKGKSSTVVGGKGKNTNGVGGKGKCGDDATGSTVPHVAALAATATSSSSTVATLATAERASASARAATSEEGSSKRARWS